MKLKFATVIKLVLAKVIPYFEIRNQNYLTQEYVQSSEFRLHYGYMEFYKYLNLKQDDLEEVTSCQRSDP